MAIPTRAYLQSIKPFFDTVVLNMKEHIGYIIKDGKVICTLNSPDEISVTLSPEAATKMGYSQGGPGNPPVYMGSNHSESEDG